MKTKLFLLPLFIIIALEDLSEAQILGDIILSKETTDNIFNDIIQLPDNTLYILADGRMGVYKTDLLGNVIWYKNYTTDVNHRANFFALTPDNGFVIAGVYSISASIKDFWILRCNSNGDTLWSRRFNNPNYNGYCSTKQIRVTKDGNYVICGYYQVSASNFDIAIIKLSPQGDLIWQKIYGGTNSEEATNFTETSDSCYIFTGYTKSYGSVGRSAYIFKTNSNGDTLWTRTYSLHNENWFRAIDIYPDGNFLAGGLTGATVTSSDIWLVKLNPSGDTLWTKKLTFSANWRQINCLQILPSGNVAITGYSMSSIYAGKLDYLGNIIWLTTYSNGTGIKIVQAMDGNFFIAGQKQFAIGGNAWFLKVYSGEPAIPVELTSFDATLNGNDVILNWSTATEKNNRGFEVQRLEVRDQKSEENWSVIGFVNGNGTTTEKQYYRFTDDLALNLNHNLTLALKYRLKQIDFDGSFEYSKEIEIMVTQPTEFALFQNYPNPFNPNTIISWQSPVDGWQTLKIYDALGNEIFTLVDEFRKAGNYNVQLKIDNKQLSSGIYFYCLKVGNYIETKKMTILK